MDVSVSATIATIAKKLITILLGDKKGRKFLLYVVGIVLFIVLLPLIALVGMFGWMAGDSENVIDSNAVNNSQIQSFNAVGDELKEYFEGKELSESDIQKASMIYISYLSESEDNEQIYADLADCFLNVTDSMGIYDLLEDKFSVVIEEKDRTMLDQIYGITPPREATNEESNTAEAPEDTEEAPEDTAEAPE